MLGNISKRTEYFVVHSFTLFAWHEWTSNNIVACELYKLPRQNYAVPTITSLQIRI